MNVRSGRRGRRAVSIGEVPATFKQSSFVSQTSGMRMGSFSTLLPDDVRPSGLRRCIFAIALRDHGQLVVTFAHVIPNIILDRSTLQMNL